MPCDNNDCWEKLQGAIQGFDRGALSAYTSIRYVVEQLSKEEALVVIDDAIARLQNRGGLQL